MHLMHFFVSNHSITFEFAAHKTFIHKILNINYSIHVLGSFLTMGIQRQCVRAYQKRDRRFVVYNSHMKYNTVDESNRFQETNYTKYCCATKI